MLAQCWLRLAKKEKATFYSRLNLLIFLVELRGIEPLAS
jgi:hypothetical protein